MRSAIALLLLDGLTTSEITPLVIVRVTRTDANTATIVIAPGWTRIVILYNGDIIFDTDVPEDAAAVAEDVDGNSVITLGNLDTRLGAPPPTGPFQANAYDQVLTTQSEPTAFTIPGVGCATRALVLAII